MRYNWIDASNYTMDTLLLFDRWIFKWILTDCDGYEGDYRIDMAKALYRYPHVTAFCRRKAPECNSFLDMISQIDGDGWTDAEMREAETAILQFHETFVVYAYPEVMQGVNYIRNWNPQRLYELVDLDDKIVLDVGAAPDDWRLLPRRRPNASTPASPATACANSCGTGSNVRELST